MWFKPIQSGGWCKGHPKIFVYDTASLLKLARPAILVLEFSNFFPTKSESPCKSAHMFTMRVLAACQGVQYASVSWNPFPRLLLHKVINRWLIRGCR